MEDRKYVIVSNEHSALAEDEKHLHVAMKE